MTRPLFGRDEFGTRLFPAWALLLLVISGLGLTVLSGCGIFGGGSAASLPEPVPEPDPFQLTLSAVDRLNSCGEPRGYALAVKIYQLSGDGQIALTSLVDLWKDEQSELGEDIVDQERELLLEPGDMMSVPIDFQPDTRILAVVGYFCDAKGECWRWYRPISELGAGVTLSFTESCIQELRP